MFLNGFCLYLNVRFFKLLRKYEYIWYEIVFIIDLERLGLIAFFVES